MLIADWKLLPRTATVRSSSSHIYFGYINDLQCRVTPSPTGRQHTITAQIVPNFLIAQRFLNLLC